MFRDPIAQDTFSSFVHDQCLPYPHVAEHRNLETFFDLGNTGQSTTRTIALHDSEDNDGASGTHPLSEPILGQPTPLMISVDHLGSNYCSLSSRVRLDKAPTDASSGHAVRPGSHCRSTSAPDTALLSNLSPSSEPHLGFSWAEEGTPRWTESGETYWDSREKPAQTSENLGAIKNRSHYWAEKRYRESLAEGFRALRECLEFAHKESDRIGGYKTFPWDDGANSEDTRGFCKKNKVALLIGAIDCIHAWIARHEAQSKKLLDVHARLQAAKTALTDMAHGIGGLTE